MRTRGFVICAIAVTAAASILNSCQSPQMAARLRYPQLEVSGAAADQLSKRDIYDIVEVASQQPKMLKPIHRIDVDKPDHAVVTGGGVNNDKESVLRVHKQDGQWSMTGE